MSNTGAMGTPARQGAGSRREKPAGVLEKAAENPSGRFRGCCETWEPPSLTHKKGRESDQSWEPSWRRVE